MPTSIRFLGYAFVAALLLFAGAMIGAVLYEQHISTREPDDFWSRWQAIGGSFGVLAAIGVAVYTDVKVDRRFEKQIDTQTFLDENSDKRQQREWNKRTEDLTAERQQFQELAVKALITELLQVGAEAWLIKSTSPFLRTKDGPAHFFNPSEPIRPFFDRLGSDIALLPQFALEVIARCETKYQAQCRTYCRERNKRPLSNEDLQTAAHQLELACGEYVAGLEQQPNDLRAVIENMTPRFQKIAGGIHE